MKKVSTLIVGLFVTQLSALEFDEWTVSGDLRSAYLYYDFNNPPGLNNNPDTHFGSTDSKGFYLVPKVSITTPSVDGFSAKITGAAVTDFGINDHDNESGTLVYGRDNKSFAILQEAYLQYKDESNKIIIGRFEADTPMVSKDDYYMLADTFEQLSWTNTSFDDIALNLGYFYKMAGVWDSGDDGTEFHSMSDASYVSLQDKINADISGIVYLGFDYSGKNHSFSVWDYYASDLYNMLYTQYDYANTLGSFSYDATLQYINFHEVGDLQDNSYTAINYSIYSAQLNGAFENGFDLTTAVSIFTEGTGQASTLGAWGGYPYLSSGKIVTWFNAGSFQNARNYKIGAGYDLAKLGINGLYFNVQYLYVDLDSEYSLTSLGEGQDYQKSYGTSLSYENDNGLYSSFTYEYTDLDNEPRMNAFYLFAGYRF